MTLFTSKTAAYILAVSVICTSVVSAPLTALSAVRPGQDAAEKKADGKETIKRTFKLGTVEYYKLHIATKMNGPQTGNEATETALDLVYKETVKAIGENGQVTLAQEFIKAVGVAEGGSQDLLDQMPKLIIKRDSIGKVDIIADGGSAAYGAAVVNTMKQIMHGQAAIYPKNSVKVGDTWHPNNLLVLTETGSIVKETIKLESIDNAKEKAYLLKITAEVSGTGQQDSKMKSDATASVSSADGKVIKLNSEASGTALGGTLKMTVILENISEAEAKANAPKPADAPK